MIQLYGKMAKKSMHSINSNAKNARSKALAYKNFNTSSKKQKKKKKKKKKKSHPNLRQSKRYFEHDTRIESHKSSRVGVVSSVVQHASSTAPIKKIKFNNAIQIYANKCKTATTTITSTTLKPLSSITDSKRSYIEHRNATGAGNGSGSGGGGGGGDGKRNGPTNASKRGRQLSVANACLRSTTKKLQKQLLHAQMTIQKQLVALQEHQRAQSKSFLALIKSNPCIHSASKVRITGSKNGDVQCRHDDDDDDDKNEDDDNNNNDRGEGDSDVDVDADVGIRTVFSPITITNKPNSHSNHAQSEQFCKHFVDECNCSNDIMANGNDTMAIRAFACDSINTICKAVDGNINSKSAISSPERKKLTFQLKKPFLKSIILSPTSSTQPDIVIKKEPDIHIDSPENITSVCEPSPSSRWHPISAIDPLHANETTLSADMNKPNRDTHLKMGGMRSSHPTTMARASKSKSTVSNDSPRNKSDKRSHGSKDRKSSKKRKHRRRLHSRSSNSRSRSPSRSRLRHRRQSHSFSRSQSRSRSTSRSRSYRRRQSRSRSSSSISPKRHGTDQKRHTKYSDDVRRSSTSTSTTNNKKDEKHCGCVYNCSANCKRSTANARVKSNSHTKRTTTQPASLSTRDRNKHLNQNSINAEHSTFNSNKHSLSNHEASNKQSRKSFGNNEDSKSNGDGAAKRSITLNSGVLLRQTPIVKLQCSPGSGSDSDDEIDERFDKKYEELLTFETNEDERREQRLLKALSDIAAKAKQKIQSISDPSNARNNHPDKNHNTDGTGKSIQCPLIDESKPLITSHDDDQSDGQSTENDFSPNNRRTTSRPSRKDSSSSSSEEEKSTRSSSRSPSIPRRRGSPSFLDRRRITSARKKPIPYQRSSPYDSYDEWDSS